MNEENEHLKEVLVLVEVATKPNHTAEVIATFKKSRERCLGYDACSQFDISVATGATNHLVIVERWDSEDAHQQEFVETTSSAEFAAFRNLLEQDLRVRYCEMQ